MELGQSSSKGVTDSRGPSGFSDVLRSLDHAAVATDQRGGNKSFQEPFDVRSFEEFVKKTGSGVSFR
jgi:hypothetical protein